MLSNWLPFLIYAFFAGAIPASMLAFTFLFATRPATRVKQRLLPFESGVSAGAPSPAPPLHRQLLPDGDALHPLRHRDRLSLPARDPAERSRVVRLWPSSSRSSRSSSSPTSTSGARVHSNGTSPKAPADQRPAARPGRPQLGARALADEGPGCVRAGDREHRGRARADHASRRRSRGRRPTRCGPTRSGSPAARWR